MRNDILPVAFAALAPLCHGSSMPENFLFGRSINSLEDLSEDLIFSAFSDTGHPATVPVHTWTNGDGVDYQSLYEFDTADWDDMRASILEASGLNGTTSALATRQSEEDPPVFFCLNQNTQPLVRYSLILIRRLARELTIQLQAYTASLSAAAAAVCQAFVFGGEQAGKTQVIRRNVPVSTRQLCDSRLRCSFGRMPADLGYSRHRTSKTLS